MNFLTSAEKIRKLRKELGMSQKDLSADGITRPFISLIESGKRSMSYNTAKILAEKFNNKAEELGQSLNIDILYLLRSDKEDARLYCTQKLKSAESADSIEEIISIAKKYKLKDILGEAYMYLGENYFKTNDYINAQINYLNALNYYKWTDLTDKEPYLYNKLGRCKMSQLEFLEALTYFNFAGYYAVIQNNDDIKRMSIYNMALCNKKLNRIDAALKYIELYLSLYDKENDFRMYIYVNVLKAECFEIENSADISICILDNLSKEFDKYDDPLLGYIYNNLGELYLKKSDFKRSLEFFKRAEHIREVKDAYNLSHTVLKESYIFINQKQYDKAVALIEKGLKLSYENNDKEYLLEGYYMLAGIYISLKRNDEAVSIYEKLADLLQKDSNKLLNVYVKLSQLYAEQNNSKKLQETLHILDELTGK